MAYKKGRLWAVIPNLPRGAAALATLKKLTSVYRSSILKKSVGIGHWPKKTSSALNDPDVERSPLPSFKYQGCHATVTINRENMELADNCQPSLNVPHNCHIHSGLDLFGPNKAPSIRTRWR